jgi:hypothetical protein
VREEEEVGEAEVAEVEEEDKSHSPILCSTEKGTIRGT